MATPNPVVDETSPTGYQPGDRFHDGRTEFKVIGPAGDTYPPHWVSYEATGGLLGGQCDLQAAVASGHYQLGRIPAPRISAAGRPPTYLGDLTVTSLTVQHPDRPEALVLEATPGGLAVKLLSGDGRPFAEISAHSDGEVAISLNEPGGRASLGLRIGRDGVPSVTVSEAAEDSALDTVRHTAPVRELLRGLANARVSQANTFRG